MQTEERRKILIVDDDPMVLKVIRSYLKDRYKVYCIRSRGSTEVLFDADPGCCAVRLYDAGNGRSGGVPQDAGR